MKDWFKKIYLELKAWFTTADEIERREKDIRWAKARLSIKANEDFKNWLRKIMFEYFELSMQENISFEEHIQWKAKAKAIEFILEQIEKTSSESIDIKEKNLELIRKKKLSR